MSFLEPVEEVSGQMPLPVALDVRREFRARGYRVTAVEAHNGYWQIRAYPGVPETGNTPPPAMTLIAQGRVYAITRGAGAATPPAAGAAMA